MTTAHPGHRGRRIPSSRDLRRHGRYRLRAAGLTADYTCGGARPALGTGAPSGARPAATRSRPSCRAGLLSPSRVSRGTSCARPCPAGPCLVAWPGSSSSRTPSQELGWRGYALRRLLPAQGPVRASLVLGVAWTFWHLPALCLPGVPWWSWALSLVFITSLSVLMTALHLRSGGSVLVAWAAHLGIHLDNVSRAHMSGDGAAPLLVTTIVALVAAAITARWMQMQTRGAGPRALGERQLSLKSP
ncbi:CPBP family intramembrane glutamic endopeptidase [Sorangium sp. So ce448]|uniref:CPBP family intramembrane glutamic endopeptidase n=1 Tax=Sorangium sp. So ce448 TaxID=3133314 RepID=UPI003F5F62CF